MYSYLRLLMRIKETIINFLNDPDIQANFALYFNTHTNNFCRTSY